MRLEFSVPSADKAQKTDHITVSWVDQSGCGEAGVEPGMPPAISRRLLSNARLRRDRYRSSGRGWGGSDLERASRTLSARIGFDVRFPDRVPVAVDRF